MIKLKYRDGDTVHGIKVIKFYDVDDRRKCLFKCPICGTPHTTFRGNLLQGRVKSCGCSQRCKREWKPHSFLNLAGQVFGDLQVIQRDYTKRDKVYFICRCKCGIVKSIFSHYLTTGKSRTCGCSKHFTGPKSNSWKGCGDITGHHFAHIRGQAKIRNLDFTITVEYLWRIFQEQKGKCRLSGVPIQAFPDRDKNRTASLDRIDNSKGYVEGNVQWIHKDVNFMKRILSQKQFINYCNLIANLNPVLSMIYD